MPQETANTLADIASDLSGVATTTEDLDPIDPTSSVLRPDAVESPSPMSPGAKTWAKFLSKRLAHLYVDAIEALGERMKPKRKMNAPEDEDVDAFGDSLALVMTQWFPDSELSAGKQCLITGTTIAVSMYVGSTKEPMSSNVPVAPSNGVTKAETETTQPNPAADAVGASILANVRRVF